ncbi:MAG: peptidyl-prolyl cis-trans isomerase [Syntrophomonas sp.]
MKRGVLLILLVVMGIMLMGCSSQAKSDVVAEVNGEKITQAQWEERYQILKKNYEAQYNGSNSAAAGSIGQGTIDENKDKELAQNLRNSAFENLVLQALLKQDAQKKGIKVADKDIDPLIENFKNSKLKEGPDAFTKYLKDNALTEKQLREEVRLQTLAGKMQENVAGQVEVSDADISKYYKDNLDKFKEQGGIQISHILVPTEKEANEILQKLQQGQDFAELAKKYSTCPSKSKGGDLGIVNESTSFVAEFKAAALQLKPGEMTSKPVKTEFGYHIIKAGERKEARTQRLDEVKNQIKATLQKEKQNTLFNNYLQELRKEANIKDYRKK